MGDISKIVKEIERHKGVIEPDADALGLFATELYVGACEMLGRVAKPDDTAKFVENKYKQVLDYTVRCYHKNPTAREFRYRVMWEQLEDLQIKLAKQYQDGKK